jgi:hypothetical protein
MASHVMHTGYIIYAYKLLVRKPGVKLAIRKDMGMVVHVHVDGVRQCL